MLVAAVTADENVRTVQEKLRDGGFYSGQIDGAFSSELAAALTRYQIRNGLPITGQLDVETSKALGAKAAVTASPSPTQGENSDTWRQLRKGTGTAKGNAAETVSAAPVESPAAPVLTATEPQRQSVASPSPSAPVLTATEPKRQVVASPSPEAPVLRATEPEPQTVASPSRAPESVAQTTPSVAASPATAPVAENTPRKPTTSPAVNITTDRLRDYVGAFVLAGLDPRVGAEADFFADRVDYYNDGVISRDKVRQDLQRYAARWPERKFWLAGDITAEPQNGARVRVTFPLRYDLRNGAKHSSGKIDKTLVLTPAGDDYEIVAVNERKGK